MANIMSRRAGAASLILALSAGTLGLVGASPSAAFGTLDGLGQEMEHERITRAALACKPGENNEDSHCFAPSSIDNLAGKKGTYGAIGSPDSDEIFNPSAHCDDADYLDVPGYPMSREQATEALKSCIKHLHSRFDQGINGAGAMTDPFGRLVPDQVDLKDYCTFSGGFKGRAKCNSIEGFGRALHGAQDFYSHSNWTDEADDNAISPANPPGLGLSAPSPLLNLNQIGGPPTNEIPKDFSTGCFVAVFECSSAHIGHEEMNKDNGHIDAATGVTSNPKTPRGQVKNNFDRAVQGAIAETKRQWNDFKSSLNEKYGKQRGTLMACAITHDHPATECTSLQ